MFEELITADKCVCCKSVGLAIAPHTLLKQLVREFEEVLRCVGRGFVYAEISNLRNIADPWMLDLKVKNMLMSWEFFMLVTL